MGRRVLTNVVTAAVGLLVSLLVIEIVLRLLGVGYLIAFRGSPDTGLQHVAGAEGWYRDEGGAYVHINSAGFRDVERTLAKPAGSVRIAVLGDSYTEAFQVVQEESFTAVAERVLRGCPALRGRPVEVLNFGISTSGTAQELIVLRDRALAYRPDVVVDAMLTENDLIDNSFTLSRVPERAYFGLENGRLVLNDSFRQFVGNQPSPLVDAYFALLPRVRLMQVLHNARTRLGESGVRAANLVRFTTVPGGMLTDYPAARQLYQAPTDPAWVEAWELTDALLDRMRADSAAAGARFLLMTLSNDAQVHPDASERARIARELSVPDLFYPDRRVAEIAARRGIDLLQLSSEFAAYASRTGEFLHGFADRPGHGHWNALGHRLAGERLAETLCARFIPGVA